MEKQNNSQFELFSESGVSARINRYKADRKFLAYIYYYEKTLLVIIGIVLTSIISFSLGIEKGKSLSMSSSIPIEQVQQIKAREETVKEPETPEKEDYIIQLASYKTKTYAEREAELLRKKGLAPLILNKGNYTVLYVGNFPSRKTAQSKLAELKKRYKDCYIALSNK
jgi:cell division protein FtsN